MKFTGSAEHVASPDLALAVNLATLKRPQLGRAAGAVPHGAVLEKEQDAHGPERLPSMRRGRR